MRRLLPLLALTLASVLVVTAALVRGAEASTRPLRYAAEAARLREWADGALLWGSYYATTETEAAYWRGQAVAYETAASLLERGQLSPASLTLPRSAATAP